MTRRPALLLLALVLAGCPAGKPTGVGPTPRATAKPAAAAIPAAALAKAVAGLTTRKVATGVQAALRGEVRMVSDHGGGMVSDHGGGIISNNGGALVGKAKYALRQAAPAEDRLADAVVTIHDAQGRLLTGPDGKPLAAVTDAQGRYALDAALPAEGVVLKVKLWNGGELAAMRPRDGGPDTPIDTATSLGAAYVLDQFVKGDQATFDKLPATEAVALRGAIEAGRGALTGAPSYDPPVLLGLATDLRAKVPAVAQKLDEIKALLLGQARIGDGRLATEVALPQLAAMTVDARGHLLFVDRLLGRVREIDAAGRITTPIDLHRGTRLKRSFTNAKAIFAAPDGTLFVAIQPQLFAIAPDDAVRPVAGNGRREQGPTGGPALETGLTIGRAVRAPDGTLYVLDDPDPAKVAGGAKRLVAIGADGVLRGIPLEDAWRVAAIAVGADGRLQVVRGGEQADLAVHGADGTWTTRASWPGRTEDLRGALAIAADGTTYVSQAGDGRVLRVAPDGRLDVLAGEGATGPGAAIDVAGALALGPDGTLFVDDAGRSQIHAVAPDGTWRHVAGASGSVTRDGDLTAIALNGPLGVVAGPAGSLLFAESQGFAVKRFDGGAVVPVAGAGRGYAGDGGPALQARLSRPGAVAWRDGVTWVLDEGNSAIRRIGTDGLITTIAGGKRGWDLKAILGPGERAPGLDLDLSNASALAVGPDGRCYISCGDIGQVWRIDAAGLIEHVAGRGNEERDRVKVIAAGAAAPPASEPARTAALTGPGGMAFGPDGDLYLAEVAGCRIRRLSGLAGDAPTIHVFAGEALLDGIGRLADAAGFSLADELARPFPTMLLASPVGLACDAAGNLYASMLGTRAAEATSDGGLAASLGPPIDAMVLRFGRDGKATMIAGPTSRLLGDPAAEFPLLAPVGLAIDAQGRLAIADVAANLLHIIPPSLLPP